VKALFKNATIFNLDAEFVRNIIDSEGADLSEALLSREFKPIVGAVPLSAGFVPPCEFTDELDYTLNTYSLIALRIEKKVLPASLVKKAVEEEVEQFRARNGYRPGRKQRMELAEDVRSNLLLRAPSVHRDTRALIDLKCNRIIIDSVSTGVVSQFVEALNRLDVSVGLSKIQTVKHPRACMTDWLLDGDIHESFMVGESATFEGQGSAKVTYKQARPSHEEVMKHTSEGRACTRLELTFRDWFTFTLTAGLEIRGIKHIDQGTEKADELDKEGQLQSDIALFGGQMRELCDDLFAALGGQKKFGKEEEDDEL